MIPKPKEIYLVKVILGLCQDIRPCVILNVYNDIVKIVPISSSSLYNPGTDFLIEKNHPDFVATGLKRTSYISGQHIFNMHISVIGNKKIGFLTGELAKAFDEWIM